MNRVIDGDAWCPLVSPDGRHVAVGRGTVRVLAVDTGILKAYSWVRARPMGWLTDTLLAVQVYEDDCSVLAVNVETGESAVIAVHQWIQRAAAGSGHWAGGYAAENRVVYDGLTIGRVDWHVGCDGKWAVSLSETAAHVYLNGAPFKVLPLPAGVVRDYAVVRGERCGVGRNGRPQLLNMYLQEWLDVTCSPYGKESEPCYSAGWIATAIERPEPLVAVRPVGDLNVIALPVEGGAVGVDFRVVGNRGIVASWNDTGTCTVQDCDLNEDRFPLPGPPEPPEPPTSGLIDLRSPNPVGPRYAKPTEPDPVVEPIARCWMGMFYAQTFKYGPSDDWAKNASDGAGLWLRAPGNCCIIAGEASAGLTAPYDHVIMTPDAILGGMADRPEYWARVAGFYLAAEASDAGIAAMQRARDAAADCCATMGVMCPPFYTYTPGRTPGLDMIEADGQTAIGLELYANPGETAEDLHNLAAQYRAEVPRGTPVGFYLQSYDRNGAYTGDLRPLLMAGADIARKWERDDPGSVKFIFCFSDGRGSVAGGFGGARWHPECYATLRAIAAACEVPHA